MSKGLRLKIRKFWGLLPTFVEVTGEKMVGGPFCFPPILNRVKKITLGKPYWEILSVLGKITEALHFYWLHADSKLCTRRSAKEDFHCSFRRALQNNYFNKKVPLITFTDTSNKMFNHCSFANSLLIVSYVQVALPK